MSWRTETTICRRLPQRTAGGRNRTCARPTRWSKISGAVSIADSSAPPKKTTPTALAALEPDCGRDHATGCRRSKIWTPSASRADCL